MAEILLTIDKEFGPLLLKCNARAVRYTFKPLPEGARGLQVTVPSQYHPDDVLQALEQIRPRLRKMLERAKTQREKRQQTPQHIDWDFQLQCDSLQLTLVRGERDGFYLQSQPATWRQTEGFDFEMTRPAILQLICPPDCDFDAEGRQQWLERVVVEAVRKQAKAQLIPRLSLYAKLLNITLKEVKVNSSKGRWGSCAAHRETSILGLRQTRSYNINLSLYTLLLPMRLQKLILLHELTHTRHMDHSPAFHHDLDQWLGGTEEALERELKGYHTTVFSFISTHNTNL